MDKSGGLNLVSLMDIFTILVFFLMVNSSDVKVLQQDKSIELPLSSAKEQPKENLVIVRLGMDRMDNFVFPEDTKVSPEKRSELNNKVGHPEDLFTYLKIGRRLAH